MKALFLTAAALIGAIAWSQQPAPVSDPLLQAMKDELARSQQMKVANLDAPYFAQYTIDDSENFTTTASQGGLLARRRSHFRLPEVRVRVGGYQFDNSNFAGGGFNAGSRYGNDQFPIDDVYAVIRRYFWLETDAAYKAAIEALSRKNAALRNISQNERLNDFAKAEPLRHVRSFDKLTLDEDAWVERVRRLSAVFNEFPDVKNSSVEFTAGVGGYIVVNTEGTEVREPENVSYVRVRAIAQAADGATLRDAITFYAPLASGLPPEAEMARQIRTMAQNVIALSRAPKGDDYSGPVLFEGAAGAQILAETLGRNFVITRRPAGDGGRGGGSQPGELEGRIGARVLPDSFDVTDDPTPGQYQGKALFGSYEADREGVAPKPLKLVEKGVLKGYLLTRQPVRGYEASNGRARMPGNFGGSTPGISNLFVTASDAQPVAELKRKLIELCKARGKEYGIIVRRMDFPSSASLDEARRLAAAAQGGKPISLPLLTYRLYLDGREELVRNVQFRGLNVRSLKDILGAGNDATVFEFMDSPATFALIGASSYTSEAAVIAPSLLIDDLELHPIETELPKLPLVPAPEITR
jgi:TldD protein